MATSTNERLARKAYDYEVMSSVASPLLSVRAFATTPDARAGRVVTSADGMAGRATVYDATYTFPIPIGPNTVTSIATARFTIPDGTDYPYVGPFAEVISRPLPWSPHVHPGSGAVCLGTGWINAEGRMLLAELVLHVMRLLNFDEPNPSPGYAGYNGDAVRWWREVRGHRPFNANLQYPVLDPRLTHGIAPTTPTFRRIVPTPAFRPVSAPSVEPVVTPAAQRFRPIVRGTP